MHSGFAQHLVGSFSCSLQVQTQTSLWVAGNITTCRDVSLVARSAVDVASQTSRVCLDAPQQWRQSAHGRVEMRPCQMCTLTNWPESIRDRHKPSGLWMCRSLQVPHAVLCLDQRPPPHPAPPPRLMRLRSAGLNTWHHFIITWCQVVDTHYCWTMQPSVERITHQTLLSDFFQFHSHKMHWDVAQSNIYINSTGELMQKKTTLRNTTSSKQKTFILKSI